MFTEGQVIWVVFNTDKTEYRGYAFSKKQAVSYANKFNGFVTSFILNKDQAERVNDVAENMEEYAFNKIKETP